MNKKIKAGLYGSYLPIYIMYRNMHENGSLGQSFQVNMSVTCCLRIFVRHDAQCFIAQTNKIMDYNI